MKNRIKFIASGVFFALFAIMIVLVRFVDVATVGAGGTSIGLSHINTAVRDALGVHIVWYDITQILGYLAILVAFSFAMLGLYQLIRRKSLKKVDPEIWALAGLYMAVIALYALFEVVIINYRPIIMPGEADPAASFPSSHTMLIFTVMTSAPAMLSKYIKNKKIVCAAALLCAAVVLLTVFGRLYCGVHWFTDILAGVLISASLVFAFSGITGAIRGRTKASRQ